MAKADIEQVRKRFEAAKARLQELQKAENDRQRKEKKKGDARRKTLIGELILHLVKTNQHQHDRLMAQLDAFLVNDKDRALFDLPSKKAPDPNAQNGQQTPAHS